MEIRPKSVTFVGPALADGSYSGNFHRLWSANGSYFPVTSVGYGRPTEVTDFYFLILENNTASGANSHNSYNKQ
jgi:hypothetical protein